MQGDIGMPQDSTALAAQILEGLQGQLAEAVQLGLAQLLQDVSTLLQKQEHRLLTVLAPESSRSHLSRLVNTNGASSLLGQAQRLNPESCVSAPPEKLKSASRPKARAKTLSMRIGTWTEESRDAVKDSEMLAVLPGPSALDLVHSSPCSPGSSSADSIEDATRVLKFVSGIKDGHARSQHSEGLGNGAKEALVPPAELLHPPVPGGVPAGLPDILVGHQHQPSQDSTCAGTPEHSAGCLPDSPAGASYEPPAQMFGLTRSEPTQRPRPGSQAGTLAQSLEIRKTATDPPAPQGPDCRMRGMRKSRTPEGRWLPRSPTSDGRWFPALRADDAKIAPFDMKSLEDVRDSELLDEGPGPSLACAVSASVPHVRMGSSAGSGKVVSSHAGQGTAEEPPGQGSLNFRVNQVMREATPEDCNVPGTCSSISEVPNLLELNQMVDKNLPATTPGTPATAWSPSRSWIAPTASMQLVRRLERENSASWTHTGTGSSSDIRAVRLKQEEELLSEFVLEGYSCNETSLRASRVQGVCSPLLLRLCGILPWGRLPAAYRGGLLLLPACSVAIFAQQLQRAQSRILGQAACPVGVCLHFACINDLVLALGSFLGLIAIGTVNSRTLLGSPTTLLVRYAVKWNVVQRWSSASLWQSLCLLSVWVGSLGCRAVAMAKGPDLSWQVVASACAFVLTSLIFMGLAFSILHVSCLICILIDSYVLRVKDTLDTEWCIQEWDKLGALLRKVSRAVERGFIMLQFAALGMLLCSFSGLLLQGRQQIWWFGSSTVLAQSLVLVLFKAAEVTEMCKRLPPLINAMDFQGDKFSTARHYLVEHITYSASGFYIGEVRLTTVTALKLFYISILATFGILTKLSTA